jgi:hypothetical protein
VLHLRGVRGGGGGGGGDGVTAVGWQSPRSSKMDIFKEQM